MAAPLQVLVMGATYGSLLATKLLLAGHTVKLACLPAEADLINREGTRVRLPVKGRDAPVEIDSRRLPGTLSADVPGAILPAQFDLVALAVQEPQCAAAGVRELLGAVAEAGLPCLSIMNMPPLPYLKRIPGLNVEALRGCYTDASVWDGFDAERMTLCSPDPQASRPPDAAANVLLVRLPTNFKAARFGALEHNALLRRLEADIAASRFEGMELPVKLKVHDSVFVPLAKWAMLMAGNYRCITRTGMRSIQQTVHGNLEASHAVYAWVVALCKALGAHEADLVPFEKYAAAAQGLTAPSSAARTLYGGARNIERVDRLVQAVAAQMGMRSPEIDEIVALVDAQLAANRRLAA
jgi:hypothetical protein